jgi:hypothetical protein
MLTKPQQAVSEVPGLDYILVIFPGFSWHNLFPNNPPNQIPRHAGHFYWRQGYSFVSAGSTMNYGAMFDEVEKPRPCSNSRPRRQSCRRKPDSSR